MKIAVVYNYPTPSNGPQHAVHAERFVSTYRQHPPLIDHTMIVVSSGGPPNGTAVSQFSFIEGTQFVETDNEGWDCGNYIKAARQLSCDMMFCCGTACYFRRHGWLRKIAEAWNQFGPGMYGTLATYEVSPHINTTGFAVMPQALRHYHKKIVSRQDRYEFEHGPQALWRQVQKAGFPVKLVTWDGVWSLGQWRKPDNIYRRGDQSNCLTFWTHSDEFESAPPVVRERMSRLSDTLTV